MNDKPELIKGGRGKQAPYISTHVRLPEPIKPLVELIKARYLAALQQNVDPAPLIAQIEKAIALAGQEKEKAVNGFDTEEIQALKSKFAGLEKENCDLRERIALASQPKPVNELSELTRSKVVNEFEEGLTQEQLATRLGRNTANVGRHRKVGDLEAWSQLLDPDRLLWRFDPKLKKYFPALPVDG